MDQAWRSGCRCNVRTSGEERAAVWWSSSRPCNTSSVRRYSRYVNCEHAAKAFVIVGPGQRVHPHMLGRSLAILLFCLLVALAIGYGIGSLFPVRANFGYWSWILPTTFLALGFCVEIGLHNRSFASEAQEVFFPDDTVASWTLFTIPWLQSFFYSFGLRLGAKYKHRKREPAS